MESIEKSLSIKPLVDSKIFKAWILRRLNQIQESQKILENLLEESGISQQDLSSIFNIMGLNYADLNEIELALDCFRKS